MIMGNFTEIMALISIMFTAVMLLVENVIEDRQEKKEAELKTRLGEAIRLIPGKSEQWLMTAFEDNCHMYFRGDASKPLAFVNVKIYGSEQPEAFDSLTGEITRILNDVLSIEAGNIYVAYEPVSSWGCNGHNF